MGSGCTVKKMISQFALTYEAVVLQSAESIDLLQHSLLPYTSLILLTLYLSLTSVQTKLILSYGALQMGI